MSDAPDDLLGPELPIDKLPWMPVYLDETRQLLATLGADLMGAVFLLRIYAWDATPRCTVPDNDVNLARISGLGPRWGDVGDLIRDALYRNIGGRLLDVQLRRVYDEQVTKWLSYSRRGKQGGRPGKPQLEAQVNPSHAAASKASLLSLSTTGDKREDSGLSSSSAFEPRGVEDPRLMAWLAEHPGELPPDELKPWHPGYKPTAATSDTVETSS